MEDAGKRWLWRVFVSNLLVLSLQEVAAVDGLYRIRVPRVSLQADRQAERQVEGYLTAFVRAVCPSHSAVSAESGLKWGGNHRLSHHNPIRRTCRRGPPQLKSAGVVTAETTPDYELDRGALTTCEQEALGTVP